MRITKFHIENLFGDLKHSIPLSDEGVTFVHGPNGCGKTTVLRMIHNVLEGRLLPLRQINFSYLEIFYSDNRILKVSRSVRKVQVGNLFVDDDEPDRVSVKLSVSLIGPRNKVLERFDVPERDGSESERKMPLSMVERMLPFLTRVAPKNWRDARSGDLLSYEEIIDRYGDVFPSLGKIKLPEWYTDRLQAGKSGIVKTQRLIDIRPVQRNYRGDESSESREVVELYSESIKDTIEKKLAESAVQSQARDRSFPSRLLEKKFPKNVTQLGILDVYRSTQERAQNLMNAGLLDQAERLYLPNRKISKLEREVLALYLADFNEKLDAFTDLQHHIQALVDIVGTKLRRKKFTVDRKKGFVFETTHGENRKLAATDLSSGEQHQLVLFYELLFSSAGIKLFLVDEPEISLHVEWQRRFIEDIQKVQKLTGAVFLVATHSPQIINNRRDLAVPLDGGVVL